jgi:hypothetical protein
MDVLDLKKIHRRYVALFGEEPALENDIHKIEQILNIVLPDDVKQVARFYSGGQIGGISHYAFSPHGPEENVVQETEKLRSSISIPHRFVVLAEPPESLIVMDCEAHLTKTPAVIWCDAFDVSRLNDIKSLSKPDLWQSYLEFFAYLLELEESDRV